MLMHGLRRPGSADEAVWPVDAINMAGQRSCLVCGQSAAGPRCAACGADADRVEEILDAAAPLSVPTFWQLFWHRGAVSDPVSELIWQELAPDFRDSLLREYRAAQWREQSLSALVMFPLLLALLASSFWAGVAGARWLGIAGGRIGEWLSGCGGMLLLFPLRVIPLGTHVEDRLLRGRAAVSARAVLDRVEFVGQAVVRRCPLPWHLNPDVLFPAAVALVLIGGWIVM